MSPLFRLSCIASLLAAATGVSRAASLPNVVVIITDQQQAAMMSCTGNPYVKTPNLDRLAAAGARFERAYATNPVCLPSRFSMATGLMPSAVGVEHNDNADKVVSPAIRAHSLGAVMRDAGYHTVWAGKTHLPGGPGVRDNPLAYGFDERLAPNDDEGRDPTVDACVNFLDQPQKKPFLLYVCLINPHDICYLAINAYLKHTKGPAYAPTMPAMVELDRATAMPPGMSLQKFVQTMCPPVPFNYAVPARELTAPWTDKPDFMVFTRQTWGESEWRLHRWAYARLTERVDGQIGRILDALHHSTAGRNSLVVFTSDHGDQDGSHRVEHKAFLYEESARVPFIVSWPGVTRPKLVDRDHLVSSGLDLLPTICDFAGIPIPTEAEGSSVRALAEGYSVHDWRNYVLVENSRSRLIEGARWKYEVGSSRFSEPVAAVAGNDQPPVRESLIDLQSDPGEMNNRAGDTADQAQLERGRSQLRDWYAAHRLTLDPSYRIQ